jgi:DNA-binding response OmpR family regulator
MDGATIGHRDVIVLVEDHEDTREMTRELLEMEGHAVDVYGDADAALAGLRRMVLVPCVILVDVRLPGRTGLDLVGELREHPALARVPIILTTASSREEVGHVRLPLLRKPFDPHELLLAVRRYCRYGAAKCDGESWRA